MLPLVPGFSKTYDDAEAVLLAGLAQDRNPIFLAGQPPLLSPVLVLATALAALSRAEPAMIARTLSFETVGALPARGATLAVDVALKGAAVASEFAAHGVRGRIVLGDARDAAAVLRPLPPVLLAFRKLVTETDIVLSCGLIGDVHPWHLQDPAARAAGLTARPLPAALLLAICAGRCRRAEDGWLPRHGQLDIHRVPVLGDELRFARGGDLNDEHVAVVVGDHVVADTRFTYSSVPS